MIDFGEGTKTTAAIAGSWSELSTHDHAQNTGDKTVDSNRSRLPSSREPAQP
jgi:hypothetical protein